MLVAVLGVTVTFSGTVLGAVIPGGDFQMYKPETGYTVTATFPGAEFDNYAGGVGDGLAVIGSGIADYSDGTSGGFVDLPGWVVIQGNNDLANNGVGDSTGMNLFAGWGGDSQRQTNGDLGAIAMGNVITISATVENRFWGDVPVDLAFELMAGGVALTPTSLVDWDFNIKDGVWQEISKTYDASALAGNIGDAISIVIGVQPGSGAGNRMVWDDVSMVVPEPVTMVLLGLGGLGLIRRRRNG